MLECFSLYLFVICFIIQVCFPPLQSRSLFHECVLQWKPTTTLNRRFERWNSSDSSASLPKKREPGAGRGVSVINYNIFVLCYYSYQLSIVPSVLWCCWLVDSHHKGTKTSWLVARLNCVIKISLLLTYCLHWLMSWI